MKRKTSQAQHQHSEQIVLHNGAEQGIWICLEGATVACVCVELLLLLLLLLIVVDVFSLTVAGARLISFILSWST